MSAMQRIGDTVSATTPIERLAAGLAILAAVNPRSIVEMDLDDADAQTITVTSFVHTDEAKNTALRVLGWTYANDSWDFRL